MAPPAQRSRNSSAPLPQQRGRWGEGEKGRKKTAFWFPFSPSAPLPLSLSDFTSGWQRDRLRGGDGVLGAPDAVIVQVQAVGGVVDRAAVQQRLLVVQDQQHQPVDRLLHPRLVQLAVGQVQR